MTNVGVYESICSGLVIGVGLMVFGLWVCDVVSHYCGEVVGVYFIFNVELDCYCWWVII